MSKTIKRIVSELPGRLIVIGGSLLITYFFFTRQWETEQENIETISY